MKCARLVKVDQREDFLLDCLLEHGWIIAPASRGKFSDLRWWSKLLILIPPWETNRYNKQESAMLPGMQVFRSLGDVATFLINRSEEGNANDGLHESKAESHPLPVELEAAADWDLVEAIRVEVDRFKGHAFQRDNLVHMLTLTGWRFTGTSTSSMLLLPFWNNLAISDVDFQGSSQDKKGVVQGNDYFVSLEDAVRYIKDHGNIGVLSFNNNTPVLSQPLLVSTDLFEPTKEDKS